jgi:hypothetical protein
MSTTSETREREQITTTIPPTTMPPPPTQTVPKLGENVLESAHLTKQLEIKQSEMTEHVKELMIREKDLQIAFEKEQEVRVIREKELEELRLQFESLRHSFQAEKMRSENEHQKHLKFVEETQAREKSFLVLDKERLDAQLFLQEARHRVHTLELELTRTTNERNAERGRRENLEAELVNTQNQIKVLMKELADISNKQNEIMALTKKERLERKREQEDHERLAMEFRRLQAQAANDANKYMEQLRLEESRRVEMENRMGIAEHRVKELEQTLEAREKLYALQLEGERKKLLDKTADMERRIQLFSKTEEELRQYKEKHSTFEDERRKLRERLNVLETRDQLNNEYISRIVGTHRNLIEQFKANIDRSHEIIRNDNVFHLENELRAKLHETKIHSLGPQPPTAHVTEHTTYHTTTTSRPMPTTSTTMYPETSYQHGTHSVPAPTLKPDVPTPGPTTTTNIPYTATKEDRQPSLTEVQQREKKLE